MMLRDGEKGKGYRVVDVRLGRAAKIRLEALGMTNGTTVLIMNKTHNGSMVVKVRGTRFAFGAGITGAVAVEEKGES